LINIPKTKLYQVHKFPAGNMMIPAGMDGFPSWEVCQLVKKLTKWAGWQCFYQTSAGYEVSWEA
jgi:hypothetical protein